MVYFHRALIAFALVFLSIPLDVFAADSNDDCFLSRYTPRGVKQVYLKIEIPWKYDGQARCATTDMQCKQEADANVINSTSPEAPNFYPKELAFESLRDDFVKRINETWLSSSPYKDVCKQVKLIVADANAPLQGPRFKDPPLVISVRVEVEEETSPRIAIVSVRVYQRDFNKEGYENIGREYLRAVPLDRSSGSIASIVNRAAASAIGGRAKMY